MANYSRKQPIETMWTNEDNFKATQPAPAAKPTLPEGYNPSMKIKTNIRQQLFAANEQHLLPEERYYETAIYGSHSHNYKNLRMKIHRDFECCDCNWELLLEELWQAGEPKAAYWDYDKKKEQYFIAYKPLKDIKFPEDIIYRWNKREPNPNYAEVQKSIIDKCVALLEARKAEVEAMRAKREERKPKETKDGAASRLIDMEAILRERY